MSFRDYRNRSANKCRPYVSGQSFRDICAKPVIKQNVPEQTELPEKPVSQNIPSQPASQYINRPASQPVSRYQQPINHYQNSVYIPSPPLVRNTNIPPQSVPFQTQQSQFMHYTQNNNKPIQPSPILLPKKTVIPVQPVQSPRPPEPQKPDPSKFIEEYVPTPPPRMVKAKVHAVRKTDNKNADFGGFGGTFDGDPDQSTPIADIPVMNNIDDYKI